MNTQESWARQLLRSEHYARLLEKLFQDAIKEAIRLGYSVNYDPEKPFQFSDFPGVNARMDRLIEKLAKDMRLVIITGTNREWEYSNASNDKLVDKVLGTLTLPKDVVEKYYNRNLDALATFQDRKTNGMNLSGRVWNLSKQFKGELEMALDIGLGEQRPAALLSQDVRQYLNEPDKLFRRVRDKRGVLQLSKAAKNYHPGQGVYRSSYKNAMRLTRTEINMAFRDADYQRWQNLNFIVGFEVHRSNNPYPCPLCDAFVGRYPKEYKFIGNHPHCRCYATAIMATNKEIDDHFDKILAGEDAELKSAYEVRKMPKGFLDYITDNKKRLLTAKQPPYWVRDNFKGGVVTGALKFM